MVIRQAGREAAGRRQRRAQARLERTFHAATRHIIEPRVRDGGFERECIRRPPPIGGVQVYFTRGPTPEGLVDPESTAKVVAIEFHGRLGRIAGPLHPAENITRGVGQIHAQQWRLLLRPGAGPRQQTEHPDGNFGGETH